MTLFAVHCIGYIPNTKSCFFVPIIKNNVVVTYDFSFPYPSVLVTASVIPTITAGTTARRNYTPTIYYTSNSKPDKFNCKHMRVFKGSMINK